MRIGIDGSNLFVANPAGPEIYIHNVVKFLAKLDSTNTYIIFLRKLPGDALFKRLTAGNPNFSYKVVSSLFSWTHLGLALELMKDSVDVFYTTVHTAPFVRNPRMRVVGMIHGLEYPYLPKKTLLKRILAGVFERYVCYISETIIVPSIATKTAILDKKWAIAEKIRVIPEGVNENFHKRSVEEILPVLEKYELSKRPYFLFVSTLQPRKNVEGLIAAFSKFLTETHADVNLVIVGKKGWDYEAIFEAPRKFNVVDKVRFLGRVPAEDIYTLFSGAMAFVNFSFDEGFGLPLLEALISEVPCVVSDIAAFRELGGKAVFFADPYSVSDMAAKLVDLYNLLGSSRLSDMVSLVYTRAQKYTWEKTAAATLEVLLSVV